MKAKVYIAAVATLLAVLPAEAQVARRPAPASAVSFYVGAGFNGIAMSGISAASELPKSLSSGINLRAGVKNRYWGAELGFIKADGSKQFAATTTTAAYRTKMSVSGPALDLMGYLPLFGSNISLVGTAGISYLSGHAVSSNPVTPFDTSKQEFGYRAGGGLSWRVVPGFSLDLMARYQKADFGVASSGISYSFGGALHF